MNDMLRHIVDLSPGKRELLELLLKEEGVDLSRSLIIPQSRETNTFPLSFSQERLWFLDQLEPGSPMYNIPSAVRLTGRLDLAALTQSLDEIVRRHEILRTTFTTQDGQPVQVISPEMTVISPAETAKQAPCAAGGPMTAAPDRPSIPCIPIPCIDLRDLPESEREAEAMRLAAEEARRPFDLTQGPLLRVTLLRLSQDDHIALLTMHHIVSDGWSMEVLIRELATLYAAHSASPSTPYSLLPAAPPSLPIQYVDFACWQREWLQGAELEAQLAFWRDHLGDGSSVLELPTDRPRPVIQSSRGGHWSFGISKDLSERVKALGQQEEVTLFMTLLAVFQTLLYRYTGEARISVGTPIANRTRAEIEGLIGFFANTVVLQTDFSGVPSFRELLHRVREVTLGAYAHQDLPFEILVEALRPERDMGHTPLFQVMFVLQNAPTKPLRYPGLTLAPLETHSGTAKFDLMLMMVEEATALTGTFEYNSDLFDAATIRRMAGHFVVLLEEAVSDPDRSIAELPLLTDLERRQLVVEWNETSVKYPQDQCLHQRFEAQVERTPEAIAVVFEDQQLSYRELNQRANQLAHYLKKQGVGPEVLVGLSVERSVDLVIGMLGVLKAGGAYLPLDPTYPSERLAFMMQDAQISVLLTQQRLRGQDTRRDGPLPYSLLLLDADWPTIAREPNTQPATDVTSDDLAYVIYTSGSTGRPKGGMIQHRSALHLATALYQSIYASRSGRQLRLSLNAPFSFDASVQQLVMLSYGHTLHIIPQEVRQDGESLLAYIRDSQLDVLDCVPSQLKLLLAAGLLDESGWVPPVILPGGEAIDEVTWQVLARAPGTEFYNMYGPTECTVDSTIGRVKTSPDRPTIGRPVANARLYVLDRNWQPVPVGVPGELFIGGAGVGRGYLNRPALTAERFVPDFLGKEPGARLYRTGDLVRYLPDGNVEFLGRIDHQVKVRGFRIELGEIEAVLVEHPAVQQAVALAREDSPGARYLAAYVVTERESPPNVSELRRFLKGKLPEYMVPSAFVMLDGLPLTPNGKIDRRALPAPDDARPDLEVAYVTPRTPVEELLASIWAQLLHIERVGVHDNFFELGGHSLLATQLVSRVRDVLQVELPLRSLFEMPTVAGLAEKVEKARQEAIGPSTPPITPAPRDGRLPLSFAQQRLWFLDQLEPGSPAYNIPDAVRISGSLEVAALEQTLNEIVRRHEVLRTTFPTIDGKPMQAIAPAMNLPLPVIDLMALPAADREAEVLRRAREEARRPFDLEQGPLLRVALLRLGEEEHIALLTMHHIVSDGWSTGVFIRELAALYQALVDGEPTALPELPIQYADFAHWQRQWLQGEVLQTHLAYWKQQLAGSPPILELPTDRPRPAVQTFRGAHQSFVLPEHIFRGIKVLSQEEGVTLFMALLAAFQTFLCRYTGQEDICVGVPIANRNRVEIERLIGFFVNTLVMRTDLSGNPDFRELLRRVRDVALGAYAHQDVPFEMLVDELRLERDMSHSPLFQVMFVFQNAPALSLELPGLSLNSLETEGAIAKFDLVLSVLESDGNLQGALEYNTDLFDAGTIRRVIRHFQRLLEEVVADPDRPISTYPLLTEAEEQQLAVEWNSTEVDYPHDVAIHQLFEAQVERTPDAVAVSFENETLTYRELNRRSNQLGHHLHKLGVGPGVLVGISVERSLEMVIGILGILKAGGAYLPLDAAYPQERLAFMIEDAQISILLTQQHLRGLDTRGEGTGEEEGVPYVLLLDADWPTIDQEPDHNPASSVTPDDWVYVIYTSGSTGRPKGVLLHHRGLCNLVTAYIRDFDVGPGSRVLQFFSFSFDGSVADIFMALLSGATLCMASKETLLPGPDLTQFMLDRAITSAVMTPSAVTVLPAHRLPALQTLITGGESCTREIVSRWGPGRRFFNAYGPTETTVASSWYRVYEPSEEGANIPIGRPLANTCLYVLDPHLQPVPVGVSGELYIGGVGVAQGYLDRPALTAERFVPDPFGDEPGARLYRTGDLVRYRPDSNIEFLGRIDHQVKVRGFRIELGEIEAALRAHTSLTEAVVLAREDVGSPTDKRLVAYVVPEREPAPTTSEMRDFLAGKLPDYMVPAAFVPMQALPLTPSGKVNRRALPAPDQVRPDLEAAYVAPRTHNEQVLAGIWAQVLGLDQIGIHDNFFELGGDSILSIQVIALANQAGLRLIPRQLFQSPTVARLATVAGSGPVIVAEQDPVEGSLPLTPIQRWFFEQEPSDPHHWNQSLMLEVRRRLEPHLLEAAMGHLLAHHDALRLSFRRGESGWEQVNVGVDEEVPVVWADLAGRPEGEQALAVGATVAETQASLNLAAGKLLRVTYFDLGAERPDRLLIVVHHLAIDGVSWRILLEDLHTAYTQLSQGKAVQLPPKTTSFQYWARRLAEHAQSEMVHEELPYWSAISRKEKLPLPVDYPGGANTEASAHSVAVSLTREETRALLQDVPPVYRTKINDVLLTALAQALAHWTGSRSFLIELEGHGREDVFDDVDLSRTVGWFTTVYPLLLELDHAEAPGRSLKMVKEQLRQVPNRGFGYGLLRYLSDDEAVVDSLKAVPHPEVSFNYLGQFDHELLGASLFRLAQESGGGDRSPRGRRRHLLAINGGIAGERLRLEWTYSENLHRRSTIEWLARDYLEALRVLIAHCQSPSAGGYTPSDFSLAKLDQKKLDRILEKIG